MTKKIFLEWMTNFSKNVLGGISKDNKHLLMDTRVILVEVGGHGLEIGLDILILLSLKIHELQLLDVAIFHSFKLNLAIEKRKMISKNAYWTKGPTTKSIVAKMASKAITKACKSKTIKARFLTKVLYPLNKHAMDSKLEGDVVHTKLLATSIPSLFSQPTFLQSPFTHPKALTLLLSKLFLENDEDIIFPKTQSPPKSTPADNTRLIYQQISIFSKKQST